MPKKSAFGDLSAEQRTQLGMRIRTLVEAVGTQSSAAEVADVSVQQLGRFMRTVNAPSFLPLARLADATGISLDWVATGRGSRSRPDAASTHEPSTSVQVRLVIEIVQTILRVYREEGRAIADGEVRRMAETEYEIMSSAGLTEREFPTGMRMSAERIRRALREPDDGAQSRIVRRGA